ncbi:MAG: Ser/Thr protein kinase RdoA (MazF antagonist) [Halieaceae bacterium]|jgi:Ser/Thr protein kinase RdoA (MazF antagonist)
MDDIESILREVLPALSEWGVEVGSAELASHSENIVFKITAKDGVRYALRVHRPGYHTLAELESERMWTDALLEYGMKVPKAYATTNGQYYVGVNCGGVVRQVGLIGWLEGRSVAVASEHLGMAEISLVTVEAAGAICAQFHNQATAWHPPSGFCRPHLNLNGLVGEQPFWGRFWDLPVLTTREKRIIDGVRLDVADRLRDYGEPARTYSMIHADMHHENLFLAEDGLMVIDFDDSAFGWHQYDLAVILFAHSGRPDYQAIRSALLAGYRTHRELSDDDLSLLPMFIMIRTLALIGWANDRPELDTSDYHRYLTDKACRESAMGAFQS